jgi:hypothetical protein
MAEDDPRWPKLVPLLKKIDASNFVSTEFSDEELSMSPAVLIRSKRYSGYPEFGERDKDPVGYRRYSYDSSGACLECGTGFVQFEPIRLKFTPTFARTKTLQLITLFDELFVEEETYQKVFAPFGVDYWPVWTRSRIEIPGVVQLRTHEETDVKRDVLLTQEPCPHCGRISFHPVDRGYFPTPVNCSLPFVRSREAFGYERVHEPYLYISPEVYQAAKKAKLNLIYGACKPLSEE